MQFAWALYGLQRLLMENKILLVTLKPWCNHKRKSCWSGKNLLGKENVWAVLVGLVYQPFKELFIWLYTDGMDIVFFVSMLLRFPGKDFRFPHVVHLQQKDKRVVLETFVRSRSRSILGRAAATCRRLSWICESKSSIHVKIFWWLCWITSKLFSNSRGPLNRIGWSMVFLFILCICLWTR